MDTDFYQIFVSQDGIELYHLPIICSDIQGFFFLMDVWKDKQIIFLVIQHKSVILNTEF